MVSALETRIDRDARFASDVSHELRSPLTTLNASIEVLRNNRDELPERAQQALELLSSDMERFTQLVEDLLEISRFDAGAVRLELEAVALVPTVESAVRSLRVVQV
jgi:signal transduction histidine kinase